MTLVLICSNGSSVHDQVRQDHLSINKHAYCRRAN